MRTFAIGLAVFAVMSACEASQNQLTVGATIQIRAKDLSYETLAAKYGVQELTEEEKDEYIAKMVQPKSLAVQRTPASLLEVATTSKAKAVVGGCEVCIYVMQNKQMHQPFLCRGLKDPAYQQTVSSTSASY